MILPLTMLRTLKVTRAQKLGLAGVFLVALIDIVVDILRTIAVIVCALPCYRGLLAGALFGKDSASKRWRSWWSSHGWWSSARSGSNGSSGVRGVSEKKLALVAGRDAPSSAGSWSTAGSEMCHACGQPVRREPSPARAARHPAPLGKTPKRIEVKHELETVDGTRPDSPLNYGIHYDGNARGPRMDV